MCGPLLKSVFTEDPDPPDSAARRAVADPAENAWDLGLVPVQFNRLAAMFFTRPSMRITSPVVIVVEFASSAAHDTPALRSNNAGTRN